MMDGGMIFGQWAMKSLGIDLIAGMKSEIRNQLILG
jgi:hypothetical protein